MKLGLVVPCYNESSVLAETSRRLLCLRERLIDSSKIDAESRVWFVDDGSTDGTWDIIEQLHRTHSSISGIKLSRNRGHQNALLAGLYTADADAVVTLDADLQDDIDVIDAMIDAYHNGHTIVFGVRKTRVVDSVLKRRTATAYYW